MNNGNYELIVFDLDSTLVDGEGIVALARAAGVEDEVERVTEEAMRGEIDFGESLRRRVAHLEGLTVKEAHDALRSIPTTPNAVEVARRLVPDVAVFSGGFYPAAQPVAEAIGAKHVRANRLVSEEGVLTGEVEGELVDDDKGEVLRRLARDEGYDADEILVVGDGSNDVPMMRVGSFAVGFDPKPVVRDAADVSVDRRDFRRLEPIFEKKRVIK
ncbi:MAG: phosphoserine phosphatase SerB [Halobacteria archaeon]